MGPQKENNLAYRLDAELAEIRKMVEDLHGMLREK